MAAIADQTYSPKTSSRKVKRHSLQPQIFLQLELSSPQGKHIDPSKVGVLKDGWKYSPQTLKGNDQLMTHVRVEHCNYLPEESEIRNEGPFVIPRLPNLQDTSSSESSESKEETEESSAALAITNPDIEPSSSSPSLASVMNIKALGRHDHLLEPLPNELFAQQAPKLSGTPELQTNQTSAAPPPPPETLQEDPVRLGDDVVDVRSSSLDLFAMIEDEDSEEDGKGKESKSKRRKSKRTHLRRTSSDGELEGPKEKKKGSLTPKRGRRKSLGAEQKRSRSGGHRSRRHSITIPGEDKSKPARRSSVTGTTNVGSRRKHRPSSDRLPRSERLCKSEEFELPESKSSSHGFRRKLGLSRSDHAKHGHRRASTHLAGLSSSSKYENEPAVPSPPKNDESVNPKASRRQVQPVATIDFAGTIASPVLSPGSARGKRRTLEVSRDWKDLGACAPFTHVRN